MALSQWHDTWASDRWLYVIASAGRAPALLAHTIHARPQGVCLWFLSFGHCCTLEAIVELLNLVEKTLKVRDRDGNEKQSLSFKTPHRYSRH